MPLSRDNASARSLPMSDIGTGTLRAIEEFNRADIELYERVRDMVLGGMLGRAAPDSQR